MKTILMLLLVSSLYAQMSMRGEHQDYIAESALQLLEENAEKYAVIDTLARYQIMIDIQDAYINAHYNGYYELLLWYRQMLYEIKNKRSYTSVYLILQRHRYVPHKTFRELANESKTY